jgi:hypothetical protein
MPTYSCPASTCGCWIRFRLRADGEEQVDVAGGGQPGADQPLSELFETAPRPLLAAAGRHGRMQFGRDVGQSRVG